MQNIDSLKTKAIAAISAAKDLVALDEIRVLYLGKKGLLTDLLKQISTLSIDEKKQIGQKINQVKHEILDQIELKRTELADLFLQQKLAKETLDVTLPGRHATTGSLHPVTHVISKINQFFRSHGFAVVSGPEIENEFYNFEALNVPKKHPARAMHDTFYFGDGRLLRTHTSPVQVRVMEQQKPPLRLIAAGKVYRCDSDVTHTPMFHQVEALVVDQKATFADLKDILQAFFSYFFERNVAVRFRPSYFPFTEPSAEVDIQCTHCKGKGCRSCKHTGWLEVLGCGMVHPNVLQAANISSDIYQGWAFGMGIDRLAMLYFGIDDLRIMFENDLAFLKQF